VLDDRPWSADQNGQRRRTSNWQPVLQAGASRLPLPAWFLTGRECEEFIRTEIIGAELEER
jgi:hypothetical protein